MNRTRWLSLLLGLLLIASGCVPTPTPAAPPSPGAGTLTVAYLDIGQGDSILILSPGGETLLIDGGNSDKDGREVIVPKLREWGKDHLDVMVATHPDADHIGGLPYVLENFPVTTVALTGQVHTTQIYERFLTDIRDLHVNAIQVRTGTTIPFDPQVTLEVLGPDARFVQVQGDNNNASIVIKLTYGQVSFMLTGDAEGEEESAILAGGADVRSTVLKVGHHGSHSSTSEAFLTAVAPQLAVISVGASNRYGHPAQEVLDRLSQHNVGIFRTDQSGTVTLTTDGASITTTTEK